MISITHSSHRPSLRTPNNSLLVFNPWKSMSMTYCEKKYRQVIRFKQLFKAFQFKIRFNLTFQYLINHTVNRITLNKVWNLIHQGIVLSASTRTIILVKLACQSYRKRPSASFYERCFGQLQCDPINMNASMQTGILNQKRYFIIRKINRRSHQQNIPLLYQSFRQKLLPTLFR